MPQHTALKSNLPAIAAELHHVVTGALEPGAELVAERAKDRVPVETGDLKEQIHRNTEPEGVYVIAGNRRGAGGAFYGHMVEHGTSHSPPEPFLVPALEESRKDILRLAKAALQNVIHANGLSVRS